MLGAGEEGHAPHLRLRLLQQFEPLLDQVDREQRHAGGVAARPREAVGKTGDHRIAAVDEHHRQRRRALAGRRDAAAAGDDDLRCLRRDLGGELAGPVGRVLGIAEFELHRLTVAPSEFAQAVDVRGQEGNVVAGRRAGQEDHLRQGRALGLHHRRCQREHGARADDQAPPDRGSREPGHGDVPFGAGPLSARSSLIASALAVGAQDHPGPGGQARRS
jgi:hypothetical protein